MYTLALTTLFALSAAAPHAHMHAKFHAAHVLDVIEPRHVEPREIEPRIDEARLLHKRESYGVCGGSSGSTCAAGFCCSTWGYCGQGPAYCGGGGSSGDLAVSYGAPAASSVASASAAAPAYSSPAESATASAPSSSSAAEPAAASSAAPAYSAPAPSASAGTGSGGSTGGFGDVYKMYTGSGAPSAGWPSMNDWMDFESLWSANLPTIASSCTEFEEKNNDANEQADLKAAIQSVGASSGVDERFILAIVMQESKGCVRVDTTDNGVVNPGLMQSHDGTGTCNTGGPGAPGTYPCPSSQITQMIKDGVEGTSSGDGLKQCMDQCQTTDAAEKYYQAATIYNSGNLPANLDDNTATPCYSTDVANRLTGWTTANTECTL